MERNKETTKRINATTNNICAIHAAVPAMPPKPNNAATIATNKKVNAHPNIQTTSNSISDTFLSFKSFLYIGCILYELICESRHTISQNTFYGNSQALFISKYRLI